MTYKDIIKQNRKTCGDFGSDKKIFEDTAELCMHQACVIACKDQREIIFKELLLLNDSICDSRLNDYIKKKL